MPTPEKSFASVAAQFGDIDPTDSEAVDNFYRVTLGRLSESKREEILETLLSLDNEEEDSSIEAPRTSMNVAPPKPSPEAIGRFQKARGHQKPNKTGASLATPPLKRGISQAEMTRAVPNVTVRGVATTLVSFRYHLQARRLAL